jgi:hypothetical protein
VGRRCQSVAYRAVGRARPRSSTTLSSKLVQERSNFCCAPFLLLQASLSFSPYTPASRNICAAGVFHNTWGATREQSWRRPGGTKCLRIF